MKYVLDVHTHTLASGHSYSTIREMANMASDKGLELLGITEHGPRMPAGCLPYHWSDSGCQYGDRCIASFHTGFADSPGSAGL